MYMEYGGRYSTVCTEYMDVLWKEYQSGFCSTEYQCSINVRGTYSAVTDCLALFGLPLNGHVISSDRVP